MAKLAYYSSPGAAEALGYPGANPGYRSDPDFSFGVPLAVEITEDGIDALLYISGGDLRKATNVFQVSSALGTKVDSDTVYKTSSTGRPQDIIKMMEQAISGNFSEARDMLDKLLVEYGLSGEDIMRQMHKNVYELEVSEFGKVRFIDKMGEIEFRIIEGSNSRIQIESLLAYFSLVGKEFQK